MENNNILNDEKYTFWDIAQKYKIIIPIIQRDYVQSKKNSNIDNIRNSLIKAIKETLEKNTKLDFDFIYGSTKISENNIEVLSLLDGQQRITTLFLLYWYFATKEGKIDDNVQKTLNNFSYSNRVSSRDFCEQLVKSNLKIEKELKVSELIKEKTWYFNEWDNDPTITSMLNMLDCIHENLKDIEAFDKLTSNKLISFCFIPLEKFNLTDELYIKMNSRGKKLTNFEIFKSKFIEILKKQNNKELLDEFRKKVESTWVDLFWKYRAEGETTVDDIFMRYIYYITEMIYGLKIHNKDRKDNFKESPFEYSDKYLILDFSLIEKTYRDEENIKLLINILNIWKDKEEIDNIMNEVFCENYEYGKVSLYRKNYNLFESCIYCKDFGWFEKELLFALLLIKLDITKTHTEIVDFIRIVRNVLLNTRWFSSSDIQYNSNLRYFEIKDRFNVFIKLLKEKDIYNSLLDIEKIAGGKILKLENEKAILINKNKKLYKDIVFMCEDNIIAKANLCNILFLIEKYPENIVKFMNCLGDFNDYNLVYRALLSFEDYGIPLTPCRIGNRYFYGKIDNIYDILTYSSDANTQIVIQNVLEKLFIEMQKENFNNPEEILNNIINNNLKDKKGWIYCFIKYKEIWERNNLIPEDKNQIFTFTYKNDSEEKDDFNIAYLAKKNTSSRHINAYYKPILTWYNIKNIKDCYSTEYDLGKIMLENGIILKISENGFLIYAGYKKSKVMEKLNINSLETSEIIINFNTELDYIEQENEIIKKLIDL